MKATPNEFGDTLAGIAGTLAFIWIIATVAMQSSELKVQQKELVATRSEVELSRKAYEKTNIHLEKQGFESLFFELLTTLNSIVNTIDLRNRNTNNIVSSGRDCFKTFAKELSLNSEERMYPINAIDKTDNKYSGMYNSNHSDLGHYFRFIHNAMRIISESDVSTKSHRRLFRSMFSDDELLIIFYNARSSHGEKMVPYIEKFELFNNLPINRLIFSTHKDFFDEKCFGDSQ